MADSAVIAAIDVGTNSVHMVVADVDAAGFTVLAAEKEVVRLGEGSSGLDHLSMSAIDRGVSALRRMKQIADAHGARVRAVATSAVREADNRDEFIRAVRQATGVKVEVISGAEEARLIHLGVSRSLDIRRGAVLAIDIGGGSTEFSLAVNGKTRIAQSLKLGAVRMTDAYLEGGEVSDAALKKLRNKVRSTLAPLAHDISRAGFDRVIVSSGTTETVARMVAAARGGASPMTFNGFRFDERELRDVIDLVTSCRSTRERAELDGLDAKRADIIVAGAVILGEIASMTGADEFEYSDFALREGVLIDTAQRCRVMAEEPVDAAFDSVRRLAERCTVDLDHSEHVAEIAAKVFRAVGRHYEVDPELERLLRAAALLANTGNAVSYSRHHLHSYYIIRNSDLVGFNDEEIELIALAARYHRKSPPKESHEEFARLTRERRHDVELMAALLRIATALDRSHDQGMREVSSSSRDGRFVLTVRHMCRTQDSVDLNITTAQSRAEMLSTYLGEEVTIRDGGRVTG